MRVPTRYNMLAGAGVAALILMGGAASAGAGNNGCNTCKPKPVPPPSYDKPCCNRGHGVIVPGVSVPAPTVNVHGGSFKFSAETYLNVSAGAQASSEATAFVSGGGGGFAGPAPVAATSIGALNVVGAGEVYTETVTEQIPTVEEYCVDEISYRQSWQAISAVCVDDTGAPHPASQVDSGQSVASGFSGEVFRCMAGTRMQVTIGSVEGDKANFDHGQTMACSKGEALVHKPGGQLSCAPQIPQRDCNERSLLRRNGPGIKIIEAKVAEKICVPQQRTVMQTVSREVEKVREVKASPITFDGGVGQGVY